MSGERAPTVTRLLEAVRAGDREALNELYARVYAELRVLARRQRQRWEETGMLNTTALVHEVYLKLVNQRRLDPSTPEHFFAIAAIAIRHIICKDARDRQARKRGRDVRKISLNELGGSRPDHCLSRRSHSPCW